MHYRREVDGLRALAVLAVILFHAGVHTFSGGFVGVDVFFVISGYLITTIITADIDAGNFSVARFYERRARRILPALFLVITACLPFAFLWLQPKDMKEFARSIVAVSAFASNVQFWRESGYFDGAAEFKPLLHTWSLAVEEQFYVFFPILLLLLHRFRQRTAAVVLVGVAALSLGYSAWGSRHQPAAAFYLLPARAWELLLGSLVAMYLARKEVTQRGGVVSEVAGFAGLALVLYAVLAFDRYTPFPDLYALVPTLGAVLLLIFASSRTVVGRVLGSAPLVQVGLLSYSAYLWHYPIFVFARHRSLHEPSAAVLCALGASALVLAWFSWRYVEQPFRRGGVFTRRNVFNVALAGSVAMMAFGAVGYTTAGAFFRPEFAAEFRGLEARQESNTGLAPECADLNFSPKCATGEHPQIAIWGDSYAMHLVRGMVASARGIPIVQMTSAFCGPFFDAAPVFGKYTVAWAKDCLAGNDRVREWLRANPSVKYVVLASPFRQFVGPAAKLLLRDGRVIDGGTEAMVYFDRTLQTLEDMGVTPVIFAPTPQTGEDLGRCVLKARLFNAGDQACNFPRALAEEKESSAIAFLRQVSTRYTVVWLADDICPDGTCRPIRNGVFIYRDSGHLAKEGSVYLGLKMDFVGRVLAARGDTHSERTARVRP